MSPNVLLRFATFLCSISVVLSAHKHRQEQLSRMKQYALLTLTPETVDEDTRSIEFEAFEQHYVVELTLKRSWSPSSVVHSNVDSGVHRPLSSNEKSCHFAGRVLNDEAPSVVSASLCRGRGLRARITAFGETLILKPSAYFFDLEADKLANHSLSDEVLVYRVSEFDRPAIMSSEMAPALRPHDLLIADGDDDGEGHRRRMYSGNDPAETEIAVIIGPVRTANYRDDYGANWYRELYLDTADMMSTVDTVYANTDWNAGGRNSVGGLDSLRIRFSEIYVVHSFSGKHSSLAPAKRFASCLLAADEYDDSNSCAVFGNEWLDDIQRWIGDNMDSARYDNVQFVTDILFNWTPCTANPSAVCSRTLGWGSVGTMCRGSTSSAVNSVAYDFGGNDNAADTIAHELGHNFGLRHDGQPGPASHCGASDGLMGYGQNRDTFSSCSLDLMEDFYRSTGEYSYGGGNYLQCLATGWAPTDGVATNVDDGNSAVPAPTASPLYHYTPYPTTAPTAGSQGTECLDVELGLENFDGTWVSVGGGFDGRRAFSFVNAEGATKFLYHRELTWDTNFVSKWNIAETLGTGDFVNVICTESELSECSGRWKFPAGDNGWGLLASSSTKYVSCPVVTDNDCDSSYSTICVTGSGGSGLYDGEYAASGCHHGQRYYRGTSGNAQTFGLFLCFDDGSSGSGQGQWTMTGSVCHRGNVVSKTVPNTATVLAPSYWLYKSTADAAYHDTVDDDLLVFDCSDSNGALRDLSCLDTNSYGAEICVSTNDTLWGGHSHRTFELFEELCSNDEPIYHYVVFNDSASLVLPSGQTLGAEIEATFYVHYEVVLPMVTDNETVGQWWISRDAMNENNRIAFCQHDDLMECTADRWAVKVTSSGLDDGVVFHRLDQFTSVQRGDCDSIFSALSEPEDPRHSEGVVAVLALAVLICFGAMAAVAVCCWRRHRYRQYQREALKVQQSMVADTPKTHAVKPAEDGNETTGITVDAEIYDI